MLKTLHSYSAEPCYREVHLATFTWSLGAPFLSLGVPFLYNLLVGLQMFAGPAE